MLEYYLAIKTFHIVCVALSGTLFALRGALHLAGRALAQHAVLRYASYTIDTALLTAALMLMSTIHQYPFANGWLTAKIGLLLLYVVLGRAALRARRLLASAAWLSAALLVFGAVIGVALAHDARGWWLLWRAVA